MTRKMALRLAAANKGHKHMQERLTLAQLGGYRVSANGRLIRKIKVNPVCLRNLAASGVTWL